MKNDDKNYVSQCLAGDVRAFETLVDKYEKALFNVVYRMTKNVNDAEDITQTVFIKAYENLGRYNNKYKFFSWIFRIAVNESLNFLEKQKRSTQLNFEPEAQDNTPEELYREIELSDQIQTALMEIDPEYRILIILKHFENCSYKEISIILNLTEKKVKSRLYTARQLLREILLQNGMETNA